MVQNVKRSRGRPRRFESDEALDRATKVFWRKGYDATTIDDLVEAMGVGRPSLYAIFGDKEVLFKTCLKRYAESIGARMSRALESSEDVHMAIAAYLKEAVRNATFDSSAPGCLTGSVAAVVDNPEVRQFVARSSVFSAEVAAKRLAQAVTNGQLRPDFPVEKRAKQLIDLTLAMGLRARVGTPQEELMTDAEGAAELICS
jgi:AcrR family transcriptional regulator